ncbi:putative oxidoreductase [compost metagenome]
MEVHSIVDCAEMMAKASLFRKESRWGFYHYFLDYPERDDANWLKRVVLRRGADGEMRLYTRELPPYIITRNPADNEEEEANHVQSVF